LDYVDKDDLAIFLRRLQWTLLALAACWLLWLLAPILTPFVFGAMLGWLGDPVVDRLERMGRSRNTAVMLVFGTMSVLVLLALVVLVPLVEAQIVTLFESLPHYRDWFVGTVLPWLERRTGLELLAWLDPERLFQLVRSHWEQAGGAAATMLGYLSRSGFALLGWIANIVLLPVLTFFFLRDWDLFVGRVAALVPRDHQATVMRLAGESSAVLGAFLRGLRELKAQAFVTEDASGIARYLSKPEVQATLTLDGVGPTTLVLAPSPERRGGRPTAYAAVTGRGPSSPPSGSPYSLDSPRERRRRSSRRS